MTQDMPWLKDYPEGLRWDADLPRSTLIQTFESSVARFGDRIFLNFYGSKTSYADFGRKAYAFAAGLQAQGIVKGSKVGLCLPNTPFYPIAYYGALLAGAIVVNINPMWAEKVSGYIKDSDMNLLVTTNVPQIYPLVEKEMNKTSLKKLVVCDFQDALPGGKRAAITIANGVRGFAASALGVKILGAARAKKLTAKIERKGVPVFSVPAKDPRIISFATLLQSGKDFHPVAITPDDVAVFQYTGGTTGGEPKAAVLTHGNLTANLAQASLWFSAGKNNPKEERQLAILPFAHVFAMTVQLNLTFNRGGTVVMLPKFDIRETLETIQREKPTMFAGVPTLYRALLDYKSVKQYDLSSVHIWLSGAMALPETTWNDFKTLTGRGIVEGYGLSETSPLAAANPIHGALKKSSIGLPVSRTEIRIFDFDNKEQEQPQGKVGGIWIRGPQVMREYYNNPAKTVEALRSDGFFYTGDDGYMDESGYFFITGRSKEMSIVNGNKVYWEIVQHTATQHPDVSEAAVVGYPDKNGGNDKVKIYVVPRPGKLVTQDSVKEFLKERMASYEIPRFFEVRDSIPKTPVGKYDKPALIKEWQTSEEKAPQPPQQKLG